MKLTDSQLVVLNEAANHPGGLVDVTAIKAAAPIARYNLLGGLLKRGLLAEVAAKDNATLWRKTGEGRFAVMLTDAGRSALGVEAKGSEEATAGKPSKSARAQATGDTKPSRSPKPIAKAPQEGTKQAQLIAMLKRTKGATIAEVVEALGWQAHTARAAISHGLGKRLGFKVSSAPEKRGRVYRIAG